MVTIQPIINMNQDIWIVTNAVYREEPAYIKYTDELKERYTKKHLMGYARYHYHHHPEMHGVFSKFWAIRNTLKNATDWVVWMDCDAAPVTMDADLREWLKDKPKKVIMLKDALGWNSGVFAVPNCPRAYEWLDWLEDMKNMKAFDHGYRDQDEMAWTFENNFRDFILEDGYDFGLNNYDDIYPHVKKPNLFVEGKSWCLHIPGYSNGYRELRFENVIRKLDGKPQRFIQDKVRKDLLGGMTVQQYIDQGAKSVMIDYPHGLGDVIMFMPYFLEMKRRNPDVDFGLRLSPALQPLVASRFPMKDWYDLDIYFPARFNERDPALKGLTKPQCNVKFDLGIPYNPDLEYADPLFPPSKSCKSSPFVGLNFCCSWYPMEGNCPSDTASMLWRAVIDAGFVPIEVFVPKNNKKENDKYWFVRNSMRDVGPGIDRMMSVLANLRGVASTSTGTFHYGMAAYPDTTLYLQNGFKASCYTSKPVLTLDVKRPDMKVIDEWIHRLRKAESL